MQEKQLFPGSFKTFDLNLVGNCDVNHNHDADSVLIFPSVSETQKDATHINVDFCMSSNCNLPKRNGNHETNDTDIKVNDLENDSAQEDQTASNPRRSISRLYRGDVIFSDLDGFLNNVYNANEIPDFQDDYGLVTLELLRNCSPNCSFVPHRLKFFAQRIFAKRLRLPTFRQLDLTWSVDVICTEPIAFWKENKGKRSHALTGHAFSLGVVGHLIPTFTSTTTTMKYIKRCIEISKALTEGVMCK
ncbi:hypothetical protein Sango_2556100 [Sesamum angolense]|uniref:Uncharacterized protein n=1 Tax=Sesamum angolense TaxID=2727404 RepID=A0AAE2BIP7_9LAMI|nr:hypothetical protein Sango_2556100 [Sesamum angolense]